MTDYLADPVALIADCLVLPNEQTYGASWAGFQQLFFRAIFDTVSDERGALNRRLSTRPRFRLIYDERRRGERRTEDCAVADLADVISTPAWDG